MKYNNIQLQLLKEQKSRILIMKHQSKWYLLQGVVVEWFIHLTRSQSEGCGFESQPDTALL